VLGNGIDVLVDLSARPKTEMTNTNVRSLSREDDVDGHQPLTEVSFVM